MTFIWLFYTTFCVGLVHLLTLLVKRFLLIYKLSWIPGPPALPIWGNYMDFIATTPEEAFSNMNKYYKKYGKTYKIWIGSTPHIHCQDPEIVQAVYKQDGTTSRAAMYVLSREYIGAGLLMGEGGSKWAFERQYLSKSFHAVLLSNNVDVTFKKIAKLTEMLAKTVKSNDTSSAIDIIPIMKRTFLDVSVGSVAGVESNTLENPDQCVYLEAADRMSEIVMARVFSPLLKFKCFFNFSSIKKTNDRTIKTIKDYVRALIQKRLDCVDDVYSENGKNNIIADAMLKLQKSNPAFTSEDVEDQVSNNIFAAFDTLSTLCSFLLHIVGNNENLQEELLKEIDSINPNLLQNGITLQDINNMQLLDRCVKEALRMFPAAPMIGRRLNQPIVTKKGTLPAGVELYTNLYNYHRDEDVYPLADQFNPDRFLPENMSKRPPLSWIPFGYGVRSCIGQKTAIVQTKVAVAMMIKKFMIKSLDKTEELKLSASLVIKNKHGIRVYLKSRIC